MLDIIRSSDTKAIDRLLRARSTTLTEAEAVVRPILEDIRRRGDRALLRYAKKFDRLDLRKTGFTVSREEIRRAYREVPRGFVAAVRVAAANIRKAARRQLPRPWTCQHARRRQRWADPSAAGARGLLRSRRTISAAFHGADERYPRARGGSQRSDGDLSAARPGRSGGR